jgi:hypothetical protein
MEYPRAGLVPLPGEDAMNRTTGGRDDAMFDVYSVNSDSLIVVRPTGILGAVTAEKIVEIVEIKEAELETGFNRFCDLTHLKGIRLSSHEIIKLAQRRRAYNPNDIHVKSAFLATDPLAIGIARMYEQLLNSPRINVRVWDHRQSAADWLGVGIDKIMF